MSAMAVADQRERYRRQAALCYEIAATLAGGRASAMIRLGDAYAALAIGQDRLLPNLFAPATREAEPLCRKCGRKMQLTYSLPRSELVPAMQAFCCDSCGETFIWKG